MKKKNVTNRILILLVLTISMIGCSSGFEVKDAKDLASSQSMESFNLKIENIGSETYIYPTIPITGADVSYTWLKAVGFTNEFTEVANSSERLNVKLLGLPFVGQVALQAKFSSGGYSYSILSNNLMVAISKEESASEPPVLVTLSTPLASDPVDVPFQVTVSPSDDVKAVEVYANNVSIGLESSAPYDFTLNGANYAGQSVNLRAVVRFNTAREDIIKDQSIKINQFEPAEPIDPANDTEPPLINALVAPDSLRGEVEFELKVSDASGISRVKMYINSRSPNDQLTSNDGKSSDFVAPYKFIVPDMDKYAGTTVKLIAIAFDASPAKNQSEKEYLVKVPALDASSPSSPVDPEPTNPEEPSSPEEPVTSLPSDPSTPPQGSGTQLYVDGGAAGTNCDTCGGINKPYKTIEYALKRLKAGQTLNVRKGTYTSFPSNLSSGAGYSNGGSGNPITVRAYPGEKVLFKGVGQINPRNLKWWVFEGFTFEQSKGFKLGHDEKYTDSSGATKSRCVQYSDHIYIYNSVMQHSDVTHYITLRCANNTEIVGNKFFNLRTRIADRDTVAVKLRDARHALIKGNRFTDIGADGVQADGPREDFLPYDVKIINNIFEVIRPHVYRDINGKAVAAKFDNVGEGAIDVKSCSKMLIEGNTMTGFYPKYSTGQDSSGSNGAAIIFHMDWHDAVVRNNYFEDSTTHVRVQGPGTIDIYGNLFGRTANYIPEGLRDTGSVRIQGTNKVRLFDNEFAETNPQLTYGSGDSRKYRFLIYLMGNVGAEMYNNNFSGAHFVTHKYESIDHYKNINAHHNTFWDIYGGIPSGMKGTGDVYK